MRLRDQGGFVRCAPSEWAHVLMHVHVHAHAHAHAHAMGARRGVLNTVRQNIMGWCIEYVHLCVLNTQTVPLISKHSNPFLVFNSCMRWWY